MASPRSVWVPDPRRRLPGGAGPVDTVVPFGLRSTGYPNRAAPWVTPVDTWLNIATLLGWVLSSIFLLSFTRLARTA